MERQSDSHPWISKTEARCLRRLLPRKSDRKMDAEALTANWQEVKSYRLQGGAARRTRISLKSQLARIRRVLSSKSGSQPGCNSAESIAAQRFASLLLNELSRFKA